VVSIDTKPQKREINAGQETPSDLKGARRNAYERDFAT